MLDENKLKPNKCTLLIDGNWLLMWRLFGCKEYVTKCNLDNGIFTEQEAINKIKERLAQAISYKLYQLKDVVDNFIYISDDSSWRKDLSLPRALRKEYNKYIDNDVTYKGQRVKDDELAWNIIYKAHKEFIESLEMQNISTSHLSKVEGDDWCFWWSNYLNNININCIIWSKDQDLKQLVKYNEQSDIFTAWMNDDNGLFLSDKLEHSTFKSDDIMDLFAMDDTNNYNKYIYQLKKIYPDTPTDKGIKYINSFNIIIEKIISGDIGDNIQPIIYKMSDGVKPRRYKATEKDVNVVLEELNIKSCSDCFNNKNKIIDTLLSLKKFKDVTKTNEELELIKEHFEYNKQLVWLDESQYPEKVQLSFLQIPYKQIKDITQYHNYKQLIPDSAHTDYMTNIYQQI